MDYAGDFNEVKCSENRRGYGTYSHGGSGEFIQTTDQANLMKELSSIDGDFTWINNSSAEGHIQSKFD